MRDKTRLVRVGVEISIAWVRISSRWISWMIDRRLSTHGVGDSRECERTWYQSPVSESSDDKYTMKALTFHSSSRRRIAVRDKKTRTRGNGMVHRTWWSADVTVGRLRIIVFCSDFLSSFSATSARVHHNLSLSVLLGSPRSLLCLSRRIVELDHILICGLSSTAKMAACRSRCNRLCISDLHQFCV